MAHDKQNNLSSVPFAYRVIATGLGSGYFPFASGTAGSAVGILLYLPLAFYNHAILTAVTVLFFVIGAIASTKVEQIAGEDPSIVVIDEIVGMWISLLYLPVTVWSVGIAFFAFRAFDVFKPPPARQAESLKSGWGIMLDDVVAGVYANIVVRILLMVFQF